MRHITKITNIQKFDLLEERFGISIVNIGVSLQNEGYSDDPKYIIKVAAEIVALNGGELEHDLYIKILANDSNGNGLGGCAEYFYKKNFFGIDILVNSFEVPTIDVAAIKIFPVKGYET